MNEGEKYVILFSQFFYYLVFTLKLIFFNLSRIYNIDSKRKMSHEKAKHSNIESSVETSALIQTNSNNFSNFDGNSKLCEVTKVTKKTEIINASSTFVQNQNTVSQHLIIKNNINSSSSSTLINANSNSSLSISNANTSYNNLNPNQNLLQGGAPFLSSHLQPTHHEHHGHVNRRQSFLHRTDSDFDMQAPKGLLRNLQVKEQ